MRKLFLLSVILIFSCFSAADIYADPPPNNDCVNATDAGTLSLDTPVQLTGTTVEATPYCESLIQDDAWIKFTITSCMDIIIDFCDDPNKVDEFGTFLFADCSCDIFANYNQVVNSCLNGNPSISWYGLEAGTYYYRIIPPEGLGDSYVLNIVGTECAPPPTGACCYMQEEQIMCFVTDNQSSCDEVNGTFHLNANCDDVDPRNGIADICETGAQEGACCYMQEEQIMCFVTDNPDSCDEVNGTFHLDANCDDVDPRNDIADICETVVQEGACCINDGMDCTDGVTETDCFDVYRGVWMGEGSTCGSFDPEEGWSGCQITPIGACCMNDGMDCTDGVTETDCFDIYRGVWMGASSSCGSYNPEEGWSGCQTTPTGACCMNDGMDCTDGVTETDCFDMYRGVWMGEGSTCGSYNPEDGWSGCQTTPTGACCMNDGMDCTDGVTETDCFDMYRGVWMGEGSTCGSYNPEDGWSGCQTTPTGACCMNDGMDCTNGVTETDCFDMYRGVWMGEGSTCGSYNPEDGWSGCQTTPTGACCMNDGMDCTNGVTETDCFDMYRGVWMGEGSTCGEYDEETGWSGCSVTTTYEYLPGDANMAAGSWPPNVIGADVTYLVNYFRAIAAPCLVGGFYNSADANGDCSVIGADVTYLVQYFRGANELHFCPDYEPTWQSSGDLPPEAPDGWPNCE